MNWVVATTFGAPTGAHILCAYINEDGHTTLTSSLHPFATRAQAEEVLARFAAHEPLSQYHTPFEVISSDEFFNRAETYWIARKLGW